MALVAVVTGLGPAAGLALSGINEVVADEELMAVACASAGGRVAPGWPAPPSLDMDIGAATSAAAALVLAPS